MSDQLHDLLRELRANRQFNVDTYIDRKINAINNFFRDNGLDSAVVGVSGGVDSAVVVALLHQAMLAEGSPIKKVLGLIMPIYGDGTSDQQAATSRAYNFMSTFDPTRVQCKVMDLSNAYTAIIESEVLNNSPEENEPTNAWTNGQMASVLRTPVMYYQAAALQQAGYKSIVVGTTNRDEGSFIGFFGKASDGMNDLQPIADIHKSEVYQVAERLNVSAEIISARPQGDVYDKRGDEEMIGAPYWFLELFLLARCRGFNSNSRHTEPYKAAYKRVLNIDISDEVATWCDNIESLHAKNKHKYEVGMPAHFIDVMPRAVPGGWLNSIPRVWQTVANNKNIN